MTTTTNEANKEEEDDDYDLLYGDVGDFSDDFEERKTTLTTKRSGTTHDAIETGTDGDFAIGKKGRTDEDQNQEDQGRTTKEHERGFGEKEEEDKTEEDDDEEEKNTSVYVANLTWWTTDRKVEQLAGEFGVVKRIHFFTEKKNGKSKGCAAVEFTTAKAAELCAENLNKRAIEGKACVVTRAPSTRDGDVGTTTLPRAPLGPPPASVRPRRRPRAPAARAATRTATTSVARSSGPSTSGRCTGRSGRRSAKGSPWTSAPT